MQSKVTVTDVKVGTGKLAKPGKKVSCAVMLMVHVLIVALSNRFMSTIRADWLIMTRCSTLAKKESRSTFILGVVT